jgi:signal transduction histidine kinase
LLEEVGLGPALRWLAEELGEEQGIKVTVDVQDQGKRLSEVQELNVFRIAQEALNNVRKHSHANRAALRLVVAEGKVQLRIEDNGVGFAVPTQDELANAGKLGLIGIRERARLAGGLTRIESTDGKGTVVTVEMPALYAE